METTQALPIQTDGRRSDGNTYVCEKNERRDRRTPVLPSLIPPRQRLLGTDIRGKQGREILGTIFLHRIPSLIGSHSQGDATTCAPRPSQGIRAHTNSGRHASAFKPC